MTTEELTSSLTETLFVPCAGRGSRVSKSSSSLPKPLLTVAGKPAFSWVIDLYPKNWRIVVALGFQGNLVREAIETFYAGFERLERIEFVYTSSYQQPEQGLSHTLLDAKSILEDRAFVFHAIDSLIDANSAWPKALKPTNQIVLGIPAQKGLYRSVLQSDDHDEQWIRGTFDRSSNTHVYAGISHVFDVRQFWQDVLREADRFPEDGETLGLSPSSSERITLKQDEWMDIGTQQGLDRSFAILQNKHIILPKVEEAIWFVEDKVVKFHADEDFIAGRVQRAKGLSNFVPEIIDSTQHTFSYRYVNGTTLSEHLERGDSDTHGFWESLRTFWKSVPVRQASHDEQESFLKFYRDKTQSRVSDLMKRERLALEIECIQGLRVESLEHQFRNVPWPTLARSLIGLVHGDLHPDNVIVNENGGYVFVDWRQDMAGLTSGQGDIYYDLGKLAHGLRVDHKIISKGSYEVTFNERGGFWSLEYSSAKVALYEELREFVEEQGWSWPRVQLIEALVYLNIAPLHEPSEYRQLLTLMGRWMLQMGNYGETPVPNPGSP